MNEKGPTIKFQSTRNKEKMLRAVREKKSHPQKSKIKSASDFSTIIMDIKKHIYNYY